MADELFELRNHFYLRNFQAGINEGGSVQPSTPALTLERDVLIYRCFIGLGNNKMVLDEVSDSAPAELLAIKLLAEYHEAKLLDQSTEPILASLSKQLQEQATQTLLVVGATIYASEGNIDDAIRTANQSTTLEGKSLLVQLYLHINRIDLADKEYAAMVQIDEEATLTQLTGAWVGINKGGDKLQEAFYIFQELGDKYTPGSVILNGQAVCHMQRGAFEDAEGLLLEALEKNSKDAEALANLAVCAQQLGKQPLRFLKQLKVVDSTHPFIVGIENFERSFERQAARYGPSRQ